jgi:hypothetical protein
MNFTFLGSDPISYSVARWKFLGQLSKNLILKKNLFSHAENILPFLNEIYKINTKRDLTFYQTVCMCLTDLFTVCYWNTFLKHVGYNVMSLYISPKTI